MDQHIGQADGGTTAEGVGASVLRVEDDLHLRGQGEFIADLRLAGIQPLSAARSLTP